MAVNAVLLEIVIGDREAAVVRSAVVHLFDCYSVNDAMG
jgi:hypothetical protein